MRLSDRLARHYPLRCDGRSEAVPKRLSRNRKRATAITRRDCDKPTACAIGRRRATTLARVRLGPWPLDVGRHPVRVAAGKLHHPTDLRCNLHPWLLAPLLRRMGLGRRQLELGSSGSGRVNWRITNPEGAPPDRHPPVLGRLAAAQLSFGDALEPGRLKIVHLDASLGGGPFR